MSRTISNFHEQALHAHRVMLEHVTLLTQEVQCWRMFGIDVEWNGGECLELRLPNHTKAMPVLVDIHRGKLYENRSRS